MDCCSEYVCERISVATARLHRLQGLLFKHDFEGSLLIAPCHAIHTWGMDRAIDVAFLDGQGRIVASYCNIRPRQFLKCHGAHAVLERFACDSPWFKVGDRVAVEAGKEGEKGEEL